MRAPSASSALPAGWTKHTDASSGREYFHHASSSTTQWQFPVGAPPPPPPPPLSEDEAWDCWTGDEGGAGRPSTSREEPEMSWAKFTAGALGGVAIMVNFAFLLSAAPAAAGRGAPYVPTFTRTVRTIFDELLPKALPLAGHTMPPTRAMHFVDLGSGDGRLVLEAARMGFTAHGWEINPLVWFPSLLRAWAARSTWPHTSLHCNSFWGVDLAFADVVIIYGLTPIMEELREKIDLEGKEGVVVVSNVFEIPSGTESALELLFAQDQVYVYCKRGERSARGGEGTGEGEGGAGVRGEAAGAPRIEDVDVALVEEAEGEVLVDEAAATAAPAEAKA